MKALVALLASLLLAGTARADDACVRCHRGLGGAAAAATLVLEQDVHALRGLACTSCHGGRAEAETKEQAHDAGRGYRGVLRGASIVEVCGRCHADAAFMKRFDPAIRVDQLAEYSTSRHGIKLREGDERVATCVSCHGAHGVRSAKDPASPAYPTRVADTCGRCHADAAYMTGRKVATDVVAKYRHGSHGAALLDRADLGSPSCTSCHGGHGATPPGVASVASVCGTCHVRQATLFRATAKSRMFQSNEIAECTQCHAPHDTIHPTDAWLRVERGSGCFECHEPADDAARKATLEIATGLAGLVAKIADAQDVLGRAERLGMEVSEPLFKLSEATDALVDARVLVHTFDAAKIAARLREGDAVAEAARGAGEKALAEWDFRRGGLFVSLGAIGLLALGLWLVIRDRSRRFPPRDVAPAAGPPGPDPGERRAGHG